MLFFPIYTWLLAHVLFHHTVSDSVNSDHHKLKKSTMSLGSIFLLISWSERCLVFSLIRRAVFIFVFQYHIRSCSKVFIQGLPLFITSFFLVYAIMHIISVCDSYTNKEELSKNLPPTATLSVNIFHFTLICNKKYYEQFFYSEKNFEMIELILLTLIPLVLLIKKVSLIFALKYFSDWKGNESTFIKKVFFVIDSLLIVILFLFQVQTYYILAYSLLSLLLGLILNLSYFIPYLASFSVFFFYGYGYWASLEEKYFVLKFLIYEACLEEKKDDNQDSSDVDVSTDEVLLSVVSKTL